MTTYNFMMSLNFDASLLLHIRNKLWWDFILHARPLTLMKVMNFM